MSLKLPRATLVRIALAAGLVGLSACTTVPGSSGSPATSDSGSGDSSCPDEDGDGFRCDDCDDGNVNVNPSAQEVCDGADDDCDGDVDEGAADAASWFRDEDADGYGADTGAVAACTAPSGYAADSGDCDDSDPTSSPSLDEICGDHADNDCDGEVDEDDAVDAVSYYPDADEDGYGDAAAAPLVSCVAPDGMVADGSDCADTVASVHPGALDVCNDGVDSDCSGTDKTCRIAGELSTADADSVLAGEAAGDHLGDQMSVAGGVDLSGDGIDDFAVAAPCNDDNGTCAGALYVFRGGAGLPSGDVASAATYEIVGANPVDDAGYYVGLMRDGDEDGQGDVLTGAPYADGGGNGAGAAYFLSGASLAGMSTLSDATAIWNGEAALDQAGAGVATAGDIDGDGIDDILVGAAMHQCGTKAEAGAAYVLLGPAVAGVHSLGTADAIICGETSGDHMGGYLTGIGDVNGDGRDDFAGGAIESDQAGTDAGRVYVFHGGTVAGGMSFGEAQTILDGEAASYELGTLAGIGDIDRDGTDDFAVGSYEYGRYGHEGAFGRVSILYGPLPAGTFSVDSVSETRFQGAVREQAVGLRVCAIGDSNGDGAPDIGFSGFTADRANDFFLAYGPLPPTGETYDTTSLALGAHITGATSYEYAASSCASAGDLDADGADEFLLGAWGADPGGDSSGAVYIFKGGSAP